MAQNDSKSIKNNSDKLKEFIGVFSLQRLKSGFAEDALKASETEQKDLDKKFYDLFHNTRLMLIKTFQEKQNIPKEEAIRFAQLYLNRLIFMFVAATDSYIQSQSFSSAIRSEYARSFQITQT